MNIQKIIALATVASFVAIEYAEEQSDIIPGYGKMKVTIAGVK